MNKWLFKNIYWLYSLISNTRIFWYIMTNQVDEAKKIITEHFNW